VRLALNHAHFQAEIRDQFEEALSAIRDYRPHLLVADVEMGLPQLLEHLGASPEDAPRISVIGLTRRGDLKTKLLAFDQGVDDILTVPFFPEELVARVTAVTRRVYGEVASIQQTLKIGDLEIDILNPRVQVDRSTIHLTGLEQSLLYLLAANAGNVLTRDAIIDVVWGGDFPAESKLVDRHIRSLRAKLHDSWRRPRFIATVRGQGYRFIPLS
jgi:two-component system alkaline phosphatase synthesis response regulator PhoP